MVFKWSFWVVFVCAVESMRTMSEKLQSSNLANTTLATPLRLDKMLYYDGSKNNEYKHL